MANLLTRDERFQNFQSLIADLKNDGAIPAQILTRLYNGFTSEFTKAEAEIKRLHDANRILTDEMHTLRAAAIERPTTADSTSTVHLMRTGIEAGRVSEAMRIPFGVNYNNMTLITVAHARELVDTRRTEITTGLKCWIAGLEEAHENGYKAVNLANTYSRAEGHTREKIGIRKMYLHHISLIADGRLDELGWCTQANNRFQVSHLCHNGGCCNPEHLVVEESARNKDRNSCQGHAIIEYSGWGPVRYNPCRHGGELGVFRKCLLPTKHITESGNYGNEA
jgi:hypothetical protein